MKIIHIVDYFHPDMGYQENHLSRIQADEGHSVTVVTSSSFVPWGRRVSDDFLNKIVSGDKMLESEGVQVIRLKPVFEYSHRIWLSGLKTLLLNLQPDFVHVHGYATINTLRAVWYKNACGYFLAVDDHMLYNGGSNRFSTYFNTFFRLCLSRYLWKKIDRLIAVSNETAIFMQKVYGIPFRKIETVLLGVNKDVFYLSPEKGEMLRNEMNLGDGKIVLYTGKIDEGKNPITLLNAAIRLWQDGLEFKLLFVGNATDSYREKMTELLHENKLTDVVMIKDAVPNDQLAQYFNAAEVAVWPHQSSMSSLEAMSCGCPVVLCESGANKERTDFGGGQLYHEGNVAELADKIRAYLNDKQLRNEAGKRAVEFTEHLDWRKLNRVILRKQDKAISNYEK